MSESVDQTPDADAPSGEPERVEGYPSPEPEPAVVDEPSASGTAGVLATALQHEVRTVELYERLLAGAEPPPEVRPVLQGLLEEARARTSRLCEAIERRVAPAEGAPRASRPAPPPSAPPGGETRPPVAGMTAELEGFHRMTIGSLRGRRQPPPAGS